MDLRLSSSLNLCLFFIVVAAADGNNEKIQATKDFVDMVTSAYEHSKALPSTDPRRHELLGTCCFVLGCFHIESTKTIMKLGCASFQLFLFADVVVVVVVVDQTHPCLRFG